MRCLLASIALASLAVPATADAQTMTLTPAISGTRLDIVATGESKRTPDIAIVSAGVVTQAGDAAGAMRSNADAMARVIAALKKAGVSDGDVQTSTVSLNPQYRYGDNVPPTITGYQATNTVTVRFRDIKKSGAILDALVASGANQVNGPSLTLDKPQAAEDEARVDAIRKARARAELYASAAGLTVKRIVSISESGGAPMPVPIMAQAMMVKTESADTAILPGQQTISVSVSVTFELG